MGLKLVTPLAEEPITLDEIKEQCRISTSATDQDTLLLAHGLAARQWLEEVTALAFGEQTFELVLDAFPLKDSEVIRLPRRPLIAVAFVQYYDTDGTLQTWSAAEYLVDDSTWFPRLAPAQAEGYSYPATQERLGAVTIQFTAGYDANSSPEQPLPEALRLALLLKVQALYDGNDFDRTIDALIAPYQAWGF